MLYCPQCGKGFEGDLDYCPACGYYMQTRIDTSELAEEFGSVDTSPKDIHTIPRDIYWAARDRVEGLGAKHGLRTEVEYHVPTESGSEPPKFPLKLVDVVWISGSRIVAAFEIMPKEKDLNVVSNFDDVDKLTKISARFKFIVNVSKVTGKAFFHRLLDNGTIVYAPVPEETVAQEIVPSVGAADKIGEGVQLDSDKLSQLFGAIDTGQRRRYHCQARDKLFEMGKQLGYKYCSGDEIPSAIYQMDFAGSRIDAVWLSGNKIVAAFVVRARRKSGGLSVLGSHMDLQELAALPAQEKFIVNVSKTTGKAYFHRLRPDGSVEYALVSGEVDSHMENKRKKHPKAGKKWTQAEDQALIEECKKGIRTSELAKIHQRTPWAIFLRLEKLGLLTPQQPQPQPLTSPQVTPSAPIADAKFCRYCGAENKTDAVFCEKCGRKIR